MGRPRKPIQQRSNGVYCVQLHLGGKRVMRSLGTRDIEVAHRRAAQAMAELEAAHKAKQREKRGGEMPRSSAAFSSSRMSLILKPLLSSTQASGLKTTSPEHFKTRTPRISLKPCLRGRSRLPGTISSGRSNASGEGRTCLLSPPADTEMWG